MLDVLEVAIGGYLQLVAGGVVADDDAVLVHLQGRDGPYMVHATLDGSLQGTALGMSVHQDHNLLSRHHRSYADSQRRLGHLVDVALEEAAVGNNRIRSQRLLASTARQRRTRFVEGYVAVGTYTAEEEVDAAELLNSFS